MGTSSTVTILKGKFKAKDTNIYGLFIISFSDTFKNIESVSVIASYFSTLFNTPITTPWFEIDEKIATLKWRGELATSVTHDIQTYLEKNITDDKEADLYKAVSSKNHEKIKDILYTLLVKPVGDRNIYFEVDVENVSHEELMVIKEEREKKEQMNLFEEEEKLEAESSAPAAPRVKDEFSDIVGDGIVLDIILTLAPVSGILINELKPGDKIMVKIDDTKPKGQNFINLLNARVDGEVVPVPAVVERVVQNEDDYTVLVKIGPGIFGKVTEEEIVKVKKFDPRFDKSPVSPFAMGEEFASGKDSKSKFLWIAIATLIIVALAFLYIIFTWFLT